MAEKTITVCGTAEPAKDGGYPVAIWEVNDAHPGGEAYVAGPAPVEVAETAAVNDALHAGTIKKTAAGGSGSGSGSNLPPATAAAKA